MSKAQKFRKRTGVFLIVAGVLAIILFYYQSLDGSVNASKGSRYGESYEVNKIESPNQFKRIVLVKYGLALTFICIGIFKLRK